MTPTTNRSDINYDLPGVPVLQAVFCDMQGKPLWVERPYQFSRMSSVGEFLVKDGIGYVVGRVAVSEGTMYVNVKQEWKNDPG